MKAIRYLEFYKTRHRAILLWSGTCPQEQGKYDVKGNSKILYFNWFLHYAKRNLLCLGMRNHTEVGEVSWSPACVLDNTVTVQFTADFHSFSYLFTLLSDKNN